MDLLFYTAKLVNNANLARIATTHASTLIDSHIRADNSTFHVVDFDQNSGSPKQRFTNQGYSDESCWSRGQAWGIAGYAQIYGWTKNEKFLHTSQRLADYFIEHLPEDDVPYWDFDAPKPGPKDTSAALVAAYGMLLLYKHSPWNSDKYLEAAIRIINAVVGKSVKAGATITIDNANKEVVDLNGSDTIVLNATINNYEFAPRRWADHGLVYADYFFLLVGNTLLDMGLASS